MVVRLPSESERQPLSAQSLISAFGTAQWLYCVKWNPARNQLSPDRDSMERESEAEEQTFSAQSAPPSSLSFPV
jgi:hypothetical protein